MQYVIGVDEVGCGSCIGNAYIGVFRAPQEWHLEGLRDSKKLSPKQRQERASVLLELCQNDSENFRYYLQPVSLDHINEAGLYKALNYNYIKAILILYKPEDVVILDGNKKPPAQPELCDFDLPIQTLVEADSKISQVMAAAILAKVVRDKYVVEQLHTEYPQYGWDTNMGYLSKAHKAAIKEFGLTKHHRNYKIKL